MREKYRILHIEDLQTDADLVARELKKNKLVFTQHIVDCKEDFEKALEDFLPDVILCDHSLPTFNSLEALNIVKAKNLHVPFILITGTTSEEFAADVIKKGADDYILKDRLTRLPSAIRNAIKKNELEKERQEYLHHLINNEKRYKALEENSVDAIVILNLEGKATYVSPAVPRMLGYTEDEIKTLSVYELLDPLDRGAVAAKMEECLANPGIPIKGYICRIKHKDGTWRWLEATLTNMLHDPSINGIIDNFHDVTEKKISEQAIEASEEKYRSFFENSMDGILLTETNGKIIAANPAACEIFQMTEEEICTKEAYGVMNTADPRFREIIEEQERKGKAKGEVLFIRKNNSQFLGEVSTSLFKDAFNNERTSMIIRDVTERKKTEQAIIENEAFTAGLLDSLSSNIAVVNAAGNIVKVNKSWNTFAFNNNASSIDKCGVGANYFEVCLNTTGIDDDVPLLASEGIKKVLSGATNDFYLEYPCHSPLEERWFYMRVKRLNSKEPLALIEHQYITERKKAEQEVTKTSDELRRTLNDLDKIMNSSLDVICSIDEDGKFVRLSAATERIWGYKPIELVGVKFMDLVYEDDKAKTELVAIDIINGIPVTMFENRYIHKNGNLVPILWSATYDEAEKLMIGIAKDATEKKLLELTVETEKQRFQNIFMQAPSCMGSLKGPDHIFETANPLYLELIGKQDILGKPVIEVLPEMVEQGFIDILDNVYKTGETFVGKETPITFYQDGQHVHKNLNFIYQAHKDISGMVKGIFFFAIDVTEQVQSRKLIESSEKRYRQIVETAQEGIWMIDEENKTTFVNQKMCEILGYSVEEMMGESNLSFKDEEGRQLALKNIERRKQGIKETHEATFISKSGKKIWTYVSTNPMFDKDGKYTGALAMITDITEKVKLEKELQEEHLRNQKELMKAVVDAQEKERAGIGAELHDNVNQLLATSRLYINICLSRPGNQKESLLKSLEYISEAIEELRRLSHALVGPTQDRIMGLIPSIQDLILDISNTKNIKIQFHHETFREERNEVGLKLVIYRIVQEQINNIIKHANADEIIIELKKAGKNLAVTIKDNGIGFDTTIQRKGIGLQNITNRAKLYDGSVNIISSPGNGCEMKIVFKNHAFGINI